MQELSCKVAIIHFIGQRRSAMINKGLFSRIFSSFMAVTAAATLLVVSPAPAPVASAMKDAGIETGINASAAIAFPSLSESSYCECVAPKKINVYKDSNRKTRGTYSPSKSYNAYIDSGDTLYLYEITSSYIKLSYPTSNGRRKGFISRGDLIGVSAPAYASKATGKATTYASAGGKSYGYFESGDQVYAVGTSGSYTAVIYEAKSNSRRWKLGWAATNDYNRCCKGSPSSGNLSEALYKNSGAYISCGFDGYRNTSGRHEGIDFKYKLDAPIYALADGKVLRVVSGSTGGSGLSTIAIYNSAYDKTVIYLHANPSVKAGQNVSKGERIGYESWRGISSKSSSHTHVEVRNGKKEYAAKSVGDSTLDNSNPSAFWKSLGYTIK